MNSSMLAGERRWASARRGGMTVLGKVAVPKPLNLPSQRLENHGLDPNVEIVPKGTLSWGSRPSSSGSNPWVSSSQSPNAEGGNVSPSHLSGRPSSGGSGTRPSTAGSERTQEPVANSWTSSSRPSSASGTLSSNQTSLASLRPRSAENRPNSSQLSRFADPVSKSSAAWGPSGTAERLGVKSSKEDGFSLSTGDFPTLGTEKDNSTKNTELDDNNRPSSASGRISQGKEDTRSQADAKHGTVNTWRADGPQGPDDDIHPNMEKWHADNPQYFNSHSAPQHFDAWRGPPMNGWYGGPRGPPFGAPVRPGGFPMEPFPYYRPQIAPPPIASSQPVPPQGPRGPHPKNGDLYRPQMPDAYARPGMPPFRPGFYPGPPGPPGPMAFESFYGPPMGYERDLPYMGIVAGPPVYNSSYPGPAPDLGNSHGRNGRGNHAGKTSSEQVESEDNTRGPKRVTLKSRNQCDQREEGETGEHNVQQPDVSNPEKNRLPILSSRKSEWGTEEDTDEALYAKRRAPSEFPTRNFEHRVHSADGVKVKSFEGVGNAKSVHDNWSNVPESGQSFPPEMSRVPLGNERDSSILAMPKNSTLMQKIDGLNAKIRVSDGRNDSPIAYNRDEERNRFQVTDTKVNNNTGKVINKMGPFERTPASRDFVSVPHDVTVPVSDKPIQPMIASRRQHHGGQQGRVDHRGKGNFNGQDVDGWRKKPFAAEASSTIVASYKESPHSSHAHGPKNVAESSESSAINNPAGRIEGDSVESHDSIDIQAQRAKKIEIAKQRAQQRLKEEEERTREQRAKALALLEELNRRTLAGEAESEKADKSEDRNVIQGEQDESLAVDEPVLSDHNNANQAGDTVEILKNLPVESNVSTLPVHDDAYDNIVEKPAPQYNDSKHKRTGYKQKQSNPLQKSFAENPASNVAAEPQRDYALSETKSSESNMPNKSHTVVEQPVPQRRKNNRSGKNKQHKLDDTPPLPPPVESTDVSLGKDSVENVVAKDTLSDWDSAFSMEPNKSVQAQEVLSSSSPNEEFHSRAASNQWKPHPSRRLPRNQQASNKVHGGDNTAVWAPVRTQNKPKGPVEASPNLVQESAKTMSNNGMGQNSLKGKRAEMERYVPKPVAKELAQQVNVPNSSSSVASSKLNDWSIGEANEGDIGHSKHRKDQGTWKQRGSLADSSHLKGAHSTSEPTKELQQSKEIIGQSVKSEIVSVNAGDGYNIPNNSNTAKYPPVKDQGATGRGKRNGSRGPAASTGNNNKINNNNLDHEKTFSGEVDVNQMDRTKENRSSPHWQPKSSSNTANNLQHGNRFESLSTESNSSPKKEHPQQKAAQESSTVGHRQEYEKRAKGRPYSPNQDPVGLVELPPAATEDVRFERNAPSGSKRNSRHNNRSGRGHEPRGDWASGHDNRVQNAAPFRDNRQRPNLHYEYQPVGPFKGNRPERVEEPADGVDRTDQRHRERGQVQSRRGGNYNRRQSGPASHVDSSGWQ